MYLYQLIRSEQKRTFSGSGLFCVYDAGAERDADEALLPKLVGELGIQHVEPSLRARVRDHGSRLDALRELKIPSRRRYIDDLLCRACPKQRQKG